MNRMDWKHLPARQRQQLLDLVVEMAYQAWQSSRHREVKTHDSQFLPHSTSRWKNTRSSP